MLVHFASDLAIPAFWLAVLCIVLILVVGIAQDLLTIWEERFIQ